MAEQLLDQALRLKARTFATRLAAVKNALVGRDEAVDLLALATLCREHVLLIGPPGTAKTMLLDRFRRLLDARYFSYLLTRFTEPTELFGPLDVPSFQQGRYKLNTAGMLPEAEIAFLDEIFQGSSAILNSLLTLINERRYSSGSEIHEAKLVTLLGSCNEIPRDPLLAAFSDRFLLRYRLDYVEEDALDDVLRLGWDAEVDALRPADGGRTQAGALFPMADLAELQAGLAEIELGGIRDLYARILRSFRAEGVLFSDRRAVKAQKAFAASALLDGRRRAEPKDLVPLVYLWADLDDEPTLRRVVADHGVPVHEIGRQTRDATEIAFELGQLRRQRARASSAEEYREVLRRLHRLLVETRRDHPQARDLAADLQSVRDEVLRAYREQHGEEEAAYV